MLLLLCCYMCFFDCKCKSLNRLGENITTKQTQTVIKQKSLEKNIKHRNTGYPALDPTGNKYFSGSGWRIMYFSCFKCVYMCLFDCKCKNLNRLGENIKQKQHRQNIHNTEKLREKQHKTHINTGYPAQDPTANIYHIFIRGGSWAGYPVFLCLLCFSRSFSVSFMFLFNVVSVFA